MNLILNLFKITITLPKINEYLMLINKQELKKHA